jgi:hypothetical protein
LSVHRKVVRDVADGAYGIAFISHGRWRRSTGSISMTFERLVIRLGKEPTIVGLRVCIPCLRAKMEKQVNQNRMSNSPS